MLENILNKKWVKLLEEQFNSRPKLTYKEFSAQVLSEHSFEGVSIKLVYDKVLDYLPKNLDKNIYPYDDLINDYRIDDEDLGDLMISIFKDLNQRFPNVSEQEAFYKKNGDEITVLRMIQFVEEFK